MSVADKLERPLALEAHFFWHRDYFTDSQIINTTTARNATKTKREQRVKAEPVWHPQTHPDSWHAIWIYSPKHAAWDNKTLTQQENQAKAIIAGKNHTIGQVCYH